MGILANPQWEIYARELVEVELGCIDEQISGQRKALRHQAYKKAGYSGNADNAKRLAHNPKVRARFRELFAEALEYRDVRAAQVVTRIDRVGRANLADFFAPILDAEGKPTGCYALKDITTLPRELTDALQAIEFTEDGPKIRLYDKNQANFTLLKHLGGLPEQPAPSANVNILSVLNVDDQRALAEALEALPERAQDADRETAREHSPG